MSNTTTAADASDGTDLEALLPTPQSTTATTGGYYHSYQHDQRPAVRQLGAAAPHQQQQQHSYYGDATLEPNTGLTNSYDYALFGLALHELLDRLRQSIVLNGAVMFVVLCFTWWTHLFRPLHLFLWIVLSAMVVTLLVVELMSLFQSEGGPDSASTASNTNNFNSNSNTNAGIAGVVGHGKLAAFLQLTEQTGLMILYHPIGRMLYLTCCGVLCAWISNGNVVTLAMGTWFVGNAALLLYCWVTYPEFRQTFHRQDDEPDNNPLATADPTSRTAAWSHYYQATSTAVSNMTATGRRVMEKGVTR